MGNLNTNQWVAVAVGVAAVLLFFVFGGGGIFSGGQSASVEDSLSDSNNTIMDNISGDSGSSATPEGLVINDISEGTGEEAKSGDNVSVNYRGTLQDGTQFDSSYDRGVPFEFTLGAGQVIEGWDQGLVGMKVGGERQLIIPSNLAYGDRAVGTIPAGSTLIFEVELLGVDPN